MPFENYFSDPLFRTHCPLVLRWSDDQLEPLVDELAPLLPGHPTHRMFLAAAGIARSIVTARKISGGGVHYARKRDPYSRPQRYRDGDPLFTWHYVKGAMDFLRDAGLVEHAVGRWYPGHKGWESVACASDKLMALIAHMVDAAEPREISERVETIVLRDRDDKTLLDYTETADTETMREQIRILNQKLGELVLIYRDQQQNIPLGRRVFNGSFERGGRFYCHGSSFQNMPGEERGALELAIAGVVHPMVEIDYSNLHITMAYAEAGETVPSGDQYEIDGFPRGLVKVAVNTLFNAPTVTSAILAVTNELRYDLDLRAACGIESSDRSSSRPVAKGVVTAIQEKHHRIESYFGSDCGATFQRTDSDMAIEVMTRMVNRTERCPLPMHDSFLVGQPDAETLRHTMTEVAEDFGLRVHLKTTSLSY